MTKLKAMLEGMCYVLTQYNTKCKHHTASSTYCTAAYCIYTKCRYCTVHIHTARCGGGGGGVAVHPLFHVSVHPDFSMNRDWYFNN